MVTAHGDIPMAVRAVQQGVFAFFEKPCRGQDLWESMRNALACDDRLRAETARTADFRSRLRELTEEERRVMEMMLRNVPSKTIAKRLSVSLRTVQVRRTSVFDRLGADSIAALATKIEMLRAYEESLARRRLGREPATASASALVLSLPGASAAPSVGAAPPI
jgi:two-component system response regulator DctR